MCSQAIDQKDFSLGNKNSSVPWGKYSGILSDYSLYNCILRILKFLLNAKYYNMVRTSHIEVMLALC